MSQESAPERYHAPRSDVTQDQGSFRIRFNFPGRNHPDHDDHGYGPLATVVESFMDPDTLIRMHPHRDEEIVSWVPAGVMRHDDRAGNKLVTDSDHLMVMNAGSGFWHAERTLAEDPPLWMLQIFVRPHSLDLEPGIQHERVPEPTPDEWRLLFGPEGSDAPLYVRNQVRFHDLRLDPDASVDTPAVPGWDTYVYVFEGSVTVGDTAVDETESVLLVGDEGTTVTATEASTVVAFCIDPDAPVTRQGTIGR